MSRAMLGASHFHMGGEKNTSKQVPFQNEKKAVWCALACSALAH